MTKQKNIFTLFLPYSSYSRKIILLIFFQLLAVLATAQSDTILNYLFVSHCYQPGSDGKRVDFRLEQLDFSPYTGVWLGGDVCSEATLNFSTVAYIDSLFDLGNPESVWTLGNHDARDGNWEYIEHFTGRKTYYAYSSNGLTRVVLNTNLVPTNCEMMDEQYKIISNVCDTIEQSAWLLLFMHHGLWQDVPGLISPDEYSHSNLKYWNSNCYDVNSNFVNSIYPKLIAVKERGIGVVCVMGDIGSKANSFEMDSDDGIHFLGCGLNHNEPDDVVLIFTYNTANKQLSWQFHNLDSLLNVQGNHRTINFPENKIPELPGE